MVSRQNSLYSSTSISWSLLVYTNPEAGEELPVVVFESVRYLFNKNLAVSGEKALTGVTLVGISA